ncbi:hypothetical protein SmJEL517_g04451 [Synchytrium microbalum]|uniref:TLC domain-containing protein n=1 Tax=Synchytrium microbalum TaxID=1806994 RepID=A0A507BZB5_9FUNG|nr:uncharacterized protein SmJEL517_g04451 [Synchytrium microbalum]TPX32448.1 hypothetical protein SmJEL517_g04451 [Synchytrium microbalum]
MTELVMDYLSKVQDNPIWDALYEFMPYRRPQDGLYARGSLDKYVVALLTVIILLARIVFKNIVSNPIGRHYNVQKRQFKSYTWQSWLAICHTVSMCWGLYLFYTEPLEYWKDLTLVWKGYPGPQMYLSFNLKLYYLTELAYWWHHLIVLQTITPRRYDYSLMMGHHTVTIALITLSYHMNFQMLGHVIMFLFDVADVFLALSKALKYCGAHTIVDILTVMFTVSWLLTRHVGMGFVIRSVMMDAPVLMPNKVWDPEIGNYYSWNVYYFFLALFLALELMCAYWMYLILKIAWNMLRGQHADDDRSDIDEDEEVEEEVKEPVKKHEKTPAAKHTSNGKADNATNGLRKRS